MRQLHPVSLRETFVTSGIYTGYQNGEASGVVEQWSVHQLPDGSQLVRVDKDARESLGASLLLEALCSLDGRIERFDLMYYHDGNSSIKQAKASYTFFDSYVEIGRTLNGGNRLDEQLKYPRSTVVYPPVTVFTGWVIRQLRATGEEKVPVFRPSVDLADPETFLSGRIIYQTASWVGQEQLEVASGSLWVHIYQVAGDPNTEGCRFWLNERDLLVKSICEQNADGQRATLLTQIAQRPAS